MIARDKFKVGQEARLTEAARKLRGMPRNTVGHVTSFPRGAAYVYVEVEGVGTNCYHMDEWEPIDGEHAS